MEMALRQHSPLCPRSKPPPPLAVRPAGLAQSFLMAGRFRGSRTVRCMVASPDYHNRKSRRTTSPWIKVTAFRGYPPRLTFELSTKIEHKKSDEETLGTYNRLLSNDASEWTSNREVETTEVHLSQNALGSSTMGEVDAVNEDIFKVDLSGNAPSSVTIGEVDEMSEAGIKEDKFEMGMRGNESSGSTVGEVNEIGLEEDLSEVDLLGTELSSAPTRKVDLLDKAGEEDLLEVDLSGTALSNDALGEAIVVDEVVAEEDTLQLDLSRLLLSDAIMGEMNVVDEAAAVQDTFGEVFLKNVLSNATHGEEDAVDETNAGKVTFGIGLPANAASSTIIGGVDVVDENKIEEETFEMDLFGAIAEKETYQHHPTLSLTSMKDITIDETLASLKSELMPLVRAQEGDKPSFGLHEKQGSNVNFHEQKQTIIAFDKQNHPIAGFPKHDQSITEFPEQNQSIVTSHKEGRSIGVFPEQNQMIIDSHEQDESIVDVPEQSHSIVCPSKQHQSIVAFSKEDQSVVAFCKQEQSIVDVPVQTQFIVGSSKQHQSIVAFHKQDQSIVNVPHQQQSIIGFHKQDLSIVGYNEQDLSIVGTLGEVQRKQMAILGRHDPSHVKAIDYKDGDYTSQQTGEDVKLDTKKLLMKHEVDSIEKTMEIRSIIEGQTRIGAAKENRMVTEDGISVAEVELGNFDKFQHVSTEEELLWGEEHYKVNQTSASAESDIHESPQDDVDPQTLRMMIHELANKNYSMGNKLFVFPEAVKADTTIDLYLNRDLSALANEPDVLVKGAFNGWRWRIFTERMHKSELSGDWWHCKLDIPKQAYRLDFVFFNGHTVYENNDSNDFVIQIESTMDEYLFEKFLVKEKQREVERLAIEEAERRTKTEEQRRREKEKAAAEAARAQAKAEVQMKKNKLQNMLGLARTCADNLWYIEPSTYRRGDHVRLYYNRHSRPLMHSTDIWMHGGYNFWTDGLSITERLVKSDEKDGDWWYADVILPEKAFVLDWVFADGSPGNARNYDNNGRQDFHAILSNIMADEDYWVEEEQRIYTRLLQERREREEAIKQKSERSEKMKAAMKEKTMRMFLLSQKHVVYTEPLEIHAGTSVDVLYNPSNTVLNGKPEVWFRCSFNRWTHPGGVLQPQKMVKANDGLLLKATVCVPLDAYMMDFVFSESEEGGIFDNRNGVDYHIPVSGSTAKETSMHIVHIAVEMAPIAKVGGLGDVVTSLSRAVQDLGHNVQVILPKYDCLNLSNVQNLHLHQNFSWSGTEIKVWLGIVEDLSVYFLEPQNGMFGVGCVYGRNDDRRFGFFCHSALEFLLQNGSSPHIIHCHDWSSAPVAWLYKEHYANSRLASARIIFTIHNLEFGAHYIGKAMTYCDKATTVSNTYSREVAGHGAIAPHREKFYGILNGIDPDIWDPYTDNFIPVHYTSENVVEGKNAAKRALQQKLGLQQTDVPIVGIVTRLTAQKGIHLIKHAIHRALERNGQVVLLGSAPDHRIQGDFCRLADNLHGVYHGQVRLCLTYDEPLSHLIYAGSDFVLVPSIFEPCGLTQLVAMRYGTIPIVRRTGGLYDTVFDVDHDKDRAQSCGLEPNGFSFDGADGNGVDYGLNRAISSWFDARDWFHSLCKRVMEQDWSWNRPALDYIELYHSAHKF